MKNKVYIYGAIGSIGLILIGGCYWVFEHGFKFGTNDRKCKSSSEEMAAITPTSTTSFAVPIVQKYGGVPAIEVMLNGIKVPMLFDTGASHTLVPVKIAQQLKLRDRGSSLAETAKGKVSFPIATLDRLQFGRLEVKNLEVSIADKDLSMGLLGQDVFSDYEITISQRSIEFRKIAIQKPDSNSFDRY
jgi:clan AA aspartic protease (TIGR02281 family)